MLSDHSVMLTSLAVENILLNAKTQLRHHDRYCLSVALQPGDLIWVREPWSAECTFDHVSPARLPHGCAIGYFTRPLALLDGRRRPAAQMPRWASRLTLRVVAARYEQLQEISEADALAEGARFVGNGRWAHADDGEDFATARASFEHLWRSSYGLDDWGSNPLVRVITFQAFDKNIDALLGAV